MAQLRNKQVLYDSLIQFQSAQQIKGAAAGTDANDVIIKSQLDAIESLIQNFEWQESALDYVVDNTAAPASEVVGDRYILSHDGGAPNAAYDGAAAGDIVEFDGSVWVATTPTTGTFISADDESDKLYYWGGSAWSFKTFESTTASTGLTKIGFDIQLDSSSAGNGLDFTAGTLSVDPADGTISVTAGGVAVGTITTANFADFAGDVETAVFTAANFVDGSTIDFTVTAGDSVTAEVSDNSLNEDKLLNLGVGTNGQLVTSDGAQGFAYIDASTISGSVPARTKNAASVTSSDEDTAVTDVFGANDPHPTTIPQVFVNGQLVECGDGTKVSVPCYFAESGVAGTAVAFSALDGNENLQWNGSIAGYELDASDEIIVQFEV